MAALEATRNFPQLSSGANPTPLSGATSYSSQVGLPSGGSGVFVCVNSCRCTRCNLTTSVLNGSGRNLGEALRAWPMLQDAAKHMKLLT